MTVTPYSKQNPFLASLKVREPLAKAGSKRNTQHLVLDLTGSGLTYEVGDSLGVWPRHHATFVHMTLQAAQATGHEKVTLKNSEETFSIQECLTAHCNISTISPKLFKAVLERQTNHEKKQFLQELSQEEQRESLKIYLAKHEVWDFLLAHQEVVFTPQELVDLLMPLLPRFYSIASSQRYVGEEVHLTIAPVGYDSNGFPRQGVCTHFLCQQVELHQPEIPVFIQPSHGFRLPEDQAKSLIMIGPGTGIAPFRAFLQERMHQQAKGKHWLFFGEWNRQTDFFYEEEWMTWAQQGRLLLDLAFSRDQPDKVYVQHKMWKQGEQLYHWLQEEEAILYVCGDAQRMAKDVEAMLLKIIQEFGKHDALAAREYIKRLRQQKRYLRDVY